MSNKYTGLTAKELTTRLQEADKKINKLEGENTKLGKLLAEVKPALATANEQVYDLRTAIDTMTANITEMNELSKHDSKIRDDMRREIDTLSSTVRLLEGERSSLRSDLRYERTRRELAENKLHSAEMQLHEVTTSNLTHNEAFVRMSQRGVRLDRNGEI